MANLQISYSKHGDEHKIVTGNSALNISINNKDIPAEERNGTAKQLLASSALYCYCAALCTALEARSVEYGKITATATLNAANNEQNQSRILAMDLEIHVEIDESDYTTFERIQKIMKNGCLVTNSLHDGINMNYKLIADIED